MNDPYADLRKVVEEASADDDQFVYARVGTLRRLLDTVPVESRSRARRIAAQKGEPVPTFDAPQTSEGIDVDALRPHLRHVFALYAGVWDIEPQVRILGDYGEATDHIIEALTRDLVNCARLERTPEDIDR